jgi:hypothetical protein
MAFTRQTCRRDIALAVDSAAGKAHARAGIRPHMQASLSCSTSRPQATDPRRGGISDPGSHSPNTSLPLMRRRASALADRRRGVRRRPAFRGSVKISSGPRRA